MNATLSPAQTPKLLENINGILTAAFDATNLAATLERSNGLLWAIGN